MYRDIFDHKGPYVYFVFSVIYLISHTSFLGLYFTEIIANFIFLYYSYKTIKFFENDTVVLVFPILSFVICGSLSFSCGGSVEELCLPFFAYANYVGIKALNNNEDIHFREWFIIGVTSGIVFWSKFSLIGYYLAFGIFFMYIYIKNKKYDVLFKSILYLVLGIITASVPVLIYFIMNHSLNYLFEVYFYDNLFLYTVKSTGNKAYLLFYNLLDALKFCVSFFSRGIFFVLCGIIYMFNKNRKVFVFLLSTLLTSYFVIYMGGRSIVYYAMFFSIYILYGLVPLFVFIEQWINRKITINYYRIFILLGGYIISGIVMFFNNSNTYMLKYSIKDYPQYVFDKYISKVDNPSLLVYGFLDDGFYTYSDITPTCRFFCGNNLPLEELSQEQDRYVKDGLVDFVITRGKKLDNSISEKYFLISTHSYYTNKNLYITYYLYKKEAVNNTLIE
ncbi:MAG: hypothetical protein E7254_03600 [Lachnospiraceae bacterium]|nr:hypothetical protein [Lachnospiraceae bacterium]